MQHRCFTEMSQHYCVFRDFKLQWVPVLDFVFLDTWILQRRENIMYIPCLFYAIHLMHWKEHLKNQEKDASLEEEARRSSTNLYIRNRCCFCQCSLFLKRKLLKSAFVEPKYFVLECPSPVAPHWLSLLLRVHTSYSAWSGPSLDGLIYLGGLEGIWRKGSKRKTHPSTLSSTPILWSNLPQLPQLIF